MSHPVAEMYKGFVLGEREQNMSDDSYFHVTVWNPDASRAEEFQYAATAYPSSPMHHSTVSAALRETYEAVICAYAKWTMDQSRVRWACQRLVCLNEGATYRTKGDTVTVFKGRKVPKGTEGVILSMHGRTFGFNSRKFYAWIETTEGKIIEVDLDNCAVIAHSPERLQELFDLSN